MADKIEANLRLELNALKQDNLQLAYALRLLLAAMSRTKIDADQARESAERLLQRLEERNQ
jgi:hypothetical protein